MCVEDLCLENIDDHWWGVVLEVFLLLFSFIGLSRVCDDYVVPSLEVLCVRWKVREDVAGASFMAFGSAAPEIVISCVTVIQTRASGTNAVELGISCILGSGMIALLLIPGVCAVSASSDLVIKRRPFFRDMFFFVLSAMCLVFFFRDGEIQLYEGLILIGLYFVYLTVLVVSPKIRVWWQKYEHKKRAGESRPLIAKESFVVRAMKEREDQESALGVAVEEDEKGKFERFFDIIAFPVDQLLKFTCPPCQMGDPSEKYYPLTLLTSMFWVSAFSWIVSSCVIRWVELSGISMAFFGITLVAAGAQIPDTIQSMAVASRGYGSMAVSNAIGSQIVNILVGLGLPWGISSASGSDITIGSVDHVRVASYFLGCAMIVTLLIMYVPTFVKRSEKIMLGKCGGWMLNCFYVIVLGGYALYVFGVLW